MQSRNRVPRRSRRSRGDLLDQKWLTYLLVFVLIALVGVFVASLKYQEAVVRYAKDFLERAKDALAASLGLKGMLEEFESQNLIQRFGLSPKAVSPKLCNVSPINSFLNSLTAFKSKSMVLISIQNLNVTIGPGRAMNCAITNCRFL